MLYLWHPAVGFWARELCQQGLGPRTPTQQGPGAVSDHGTEWPAATGAQLNMAVAGVSRQAAAQVSRDAQGSGACAGECSGWECSPGPSLRGGRGTLGQAGGGIEGRPLHPQGRSPGLGPLSPLQPRPPPGPLQASKPETWFQTPNLTVNILLVSWWPPSYGGKSVFPHRVRSLLQALGRPTCWETLLPVQPVPLLQDLFSNPQSLLRIPWDPRHSLPSGPITPRTLGTELLLFSSLGTGLSNMV